MFDQKLSLEEIQNLFRISNLFQKLPKIINQIFYEKFEINGCGDYIECVLGDKDKDKNYEITFNGEGCALMKASAVLLYKFIKNKNFDEECIVDFQKLSEKEFEDEVLPVLRNLKKLHFDQSRSRCIDLPWTSYKEAINKFNLKNRRE